MTEEPNLAEQKDKAAKEVGSRQTGRDGSAEAIAAQPLSARVYAFITLMGLLIALVFTLFYVYEVPRLVQSGTQNQLFYLLLIPWGLSCAAFLFGAMRTYATLTYKQIGGAVELGGPIVVFALIIFGGFRLVPPSPQTFDIAVRAQSADSPLITGGEITLDLPGLPHATIGPDGEANFKGLSGQIQIQSIRVLPKVGGYAQRWLTPVVNGNVLGVTLEKDQPSTILTGSITPLPPAGEKTVILVEGQDGEFSPDEFGRFKVTVHEKSGTSVRLRIYQGKDLVYDDYVQLPGPATLSLVRPH